MRSRLAVFGLGILLAMGIGLVLNNGPENDVELRRPAFLGKAPLVHAQESGASFLEEDAGIAAYVKLDQPIDIEQLRENFKVVEQLNDQYLTGQIAVPDLKENWHPRMFVSQDGWVVAYYPKEDPTSKMLVRWVLGDDAELTGTTLELAIREVLKNTQTGMVSASEQLNYYHFQYPNADRVMLIRENTDDSAKDTFSLRVPNRLQVVDATWIAYDNDGGDCCPYPYSGINIDDTKLTGGQNETTWRRFGDLISHLDKNSEHKFSVWRGKYGLLLLYQAP